MTQSILTSLLILIVISCYLFTTVTATDYTTSKVTVLLTDTSSQATVDAGVKIIGDLFVSNNCAIYTQAVPVNPTWKKVDFFLVLDTETISTQCDQAKFTTIMADKEATGKFISLSPASSSSIDSQNCFVKNAGTFSAIKCGPNCPMPCDVGGSCDNGSNCYNFLYCEQKLHVCSSSFTVTSGFYAIAVVIATVFTFLL
jgi:hypothetical protein